MGWRLIIFMVVMPLLWLALHLYLDRRLVKHGALPLRARRGLRVLIVACAVVPVVTMTLGRAGLGDASLRPLWLLGFGLLGLSSIALVLQLGVDLVRLGRRGVLRLRRQQAADAPLDPARRGFFGQLANLGVVGTATGVAGFGFLQAHATPKVVRTQVPIAGLPRALQGLRIAQMTDIHVGPTIKREYLQRCVDACNAEGADIIAVTGDLIDGFVAQLRDEVAPLQQLRAPEGVYFVTGNHEYYWDGLAWCDEVARLGMRVLNNEHVVIERDGATLLLAGVTDISAGQMVAAHRSDPARARAGAPACDVSVLLAHQPRSVFAAAAAGYDLQISGHTHGGQYFPMNLLVYLAQPYVAGLAKHEATWIYVSRGTGYWGPPMRAGAPAEITVLELVAAPA
ncbi:MAG: metallophosphoesterase [Nannocystaceae bacterium]